MPAQRPNGPPVYDRRGYELDYEKCKTAPGNNPRKPTESREEMMNRRLEEGERKAEIVGVEHSHLNELGTDYLVGKKLGGPYHKIGMEDYENFQEISMEL
jgi:hypothetical protein